jgi:hypothetical protein
MEKKTFFAILGLLVFLCLLCSCLGTLRGSLNANGDANVPPGLNGRLTQQLSVADIDRATPPGCESQLRQGRFVLEEGASCRLTIKSSSLPVRALSLQVTRGDLVRVMTNPNEENRLTAEQTLNRGEHAKAQIFQEGGTLEITCLSGGSDGNCEITTGE